MTDGLVNKRPGDTFYVLNCGLDWVGMSFRQLDGDLDAARAKLDRIGPWRWSLTESPPGTYDDQLRDLRLQAGLTTTSTGLELAWIEATGEMLHPGTVSFVETIGRGALENAGLEVGEAPTVNRVDLATDVHFEDASEAQLALRGFAAMLVPRHKIHVVYGEGSKVIETVSWLNSSGVQLRIYDKTAESGGRGNLAGRVVRIERQIRRRYRDQWTVPQFYAQDLSKEAIAPLKLGDHQRVLVSDFRGVDAELRERRDRGETTDAVSEGLLGALVRAYAAGPKAWTNPKTARRRYTQLARAGIAVDPDLTERVDLGKILVAVQAEWEKDGLGVEV